MCKHDEYIAARASDCVDMAKQGGEEQDMRPERQREVTSYRVLQSTVLKIVLNQRVTWPDLYFCRIPLATMLKTDSRGQDWKHG